VGVTADGRPQTVGGRHSGDSSRSFKHLPCLPDGRDGAMRIRRVDWLPDRLPARYSVGPKRILSLDREESGAGQLNRKRGGRSFSRFLLQPKGLSSPPDYCECFQRLHLSRGGGLCCGCSMLGGSVFHLPPCILPCSTLPPKIDSPLDAPCV